MPTSETGAPRYKIRAFSRRTQEWITAEACSIPDTASNWVSNGFIERLIEEVPITKFQDIGNVTTRIPPEVTFTWYKQDKIAFEHKDKYFQVRSRTADLPAELGIWRCLLCPSEAVATDNRLILAETGNGKETANEKSQVDEAKGEEDVIKSADKEEYVQESTTRKDEGADKASREKAKAWFKKLQAGENTQDVKASIFEDWNEEPAEDK